MHSPSSLGDIAIDDAYSLLLHPANRVHLEEQNYYVYMLFAQGEVLYIGYTDHMSQRRAQHKLDGRIPFTSSSFIVLRDETEAKNLERQLITKYRPPYNRQLTEAVLTGTIESRQADRLEKMRQRDADRLARLEELRRQRDAEASTPLDPNQAAVQDWNEANHLIRLALWRDLLGSVEVRSMNEFEAATYISLKCQGAISSKMGGGFQSFNTEHAVRYGVSEAVVISLFQDWIGFNRAMGRNSLDGRTYTSQTVEGFASHVDFMNAHRMRDALDRLVGTGVLDKIALPSRTGRMLAYAFKDEKQFYPDWWDEGMPGAGISVAGPKAK